MIPWREAQHSPFIASLFVERLYGISAAHFVTWMVLWIALASIFSLLLGYSRVPYSAALDGNFFPFFAKLHPTKHFPHVSLLVLGALAFAVFSIVLRLETAIAAILADALDHSVHRSGRRFHFIAQALGHGAPLPFKMWLYPLPAVFTMIGWAWLFWQTGPARKYGLMEIALGVTAYMVWARLRNFWLFQAPDGGFRRE